MVSTLKSIDAMTPEELRVALVQEIRENGKIQRRVAELQHVLLRQSEAAEALSLALRRVL